jgi:anaerobic selenocysteine-containing dehydrogenase
MCACRCGIRVHLRDRASGPEVRYIEGNPEHPLNQGVICAKGSSSGIMKQYSPARLTQPLRAQGGHRARGGEFEPISWDEAFRLLEDRLRRPARHRPQASSRCSPGATRCRR